MRYFLGLIFFFISFLGSAQNLVPNGNFETAYGRGVSHWVQPPGEFYHYEDMWLDTSGERYYNHLNGLCLIHPLPSEYMYVLLKEPIQEGKQYCIKFKLFFKSNQWDRPEWLKKVQMAFLNEGIELNKRTRIFEQADLEFEVDTLSERPFWQYVETTFTAQRSGKYLYIGRFFDDETGRALDEWSEFEKQTFIERDEWVQFTKDSFNGRSLEFDEPKNKRDLKRQVKLLTDFTKVNAYQRDTTVRWINRWYQGYLDSCKNARLQAMYFQVRAYFDDICISEKQLDGTCNCSDTLKPPKFEKGKTYTLKNIFFDLDKSSLKIESSIELEKLFQTLKENPGLHIQIIGHTDSINSAAYNLKLSSDRAKGVMNWLIVKGISPKRLEFKGYGEEKPIADNSTEEGRAMNRRVEFLVTKSEK